MGRPKKIESDFNQTKYIKEWQKENLERISFTMPKGQRAKIQAIAKQRGFKSTNAYLHDLVKRDMER